MARMPPRLQMDCTFHVSDFAPIPIGRKTERTATTAVKIFMFMELRTEGVLTRSIEQSCCSQQHCSLSLLSATTLSPRNRCSSVERVVEEVTPFPYSHIYLQKFGVSPSLLSSTLRLWRRQCYASASIGWGFHHHHQQPYYWLFPGFFLWILPQLQHENE